MTVRLLLVDDHPVVRSALKLAIEQAFPKAAVSEAGSLAAAEAALRRSAPFDLIILDLCLPDGAGLSNVVAMKRLAHGAKIAVFSSLEPGDVAASALRLGAGAYIPKSTSFADLVGELRRTLSGTRGPLTAQAASSDNATFRRVLEDLTAAQLRILVALADGQRNREIAIAAGVSEATVKAHLTAIYKRLGVENRTQAVLAARPLAAAKPHHSG